jgi:hypothetical protein
MTRSAPLPQYTHQHHFGWSAAYLPTSVGSAGRHDGFALQSCDRIDSVRRGIQARPVTSSSRDRVPLAASCVDKLHCSLSML